jgi:type III secretion protein R
MKLDPVTLMVVLALVALLPAMAVMTTSFLKISVVLMIVRNALGIQQVPPNIALYALALILSVYVMGPVVVQIGAELGGEVAGPRQTGVQDGPAAVFDAIARGAEPLRTFMFKHSKPEQRAFFLDTAQRLWGEAASRGVDERNFLVLLPSFLVSELIVAFQVGFLLYLPFIVIDLIVSNVLLAMGMMMVSPVTISMPLKLFLFVMVDGWTRLIQGLVLSYA